MADPEFDPTQAARFARLALDCIHNRNDETMQIMQGQLELDDGQEPLGEQYEVGERAHPRSPEFSVRWASSSPLIEVSEHDSWASDVD